jgi:hypothetical protein
MPNTERTVRAVTAGPRQVLATLHHRNCRRCAARRAGRLHRRESCHFHPLSVRQGNMGLPQGYSPMTPSRFIRR